MSASNNIVRPDSKGRITLGHLAKGVSSYRIHRLKDGQLMLEPNVEIPAREAWLFKNKTAMAKVRQGLEDAALGAISDLGDFSRYTDDELE